MKPGITIQVIAEPDDDKLYQFRITLSNGETATSLDFWAYGDNFREFGRKLIDFPKTQNDVVTYELGKDKTEGSSQWAYYLQLRVFCSDSFTPSAINVVVDNHAGVPERQRSEFYIKSNPATLNKLGHKLNSWAPAGQKELTWYANEVE